MQRTGDVGDGHPLADVELEDQPVLGFETAERRLQRVLDLGRRPSRLERLDSSVGAIRRGEVFQHALVLEVPADTFGQPGSHRAEFLHARTDALVVAKHVDRLLDAEAVPRNQLLEADGDDAHSIGSSRGPPLSPAFTAEVAKLVDDDDGEVGGRRALAAEPLEDRLPGHDEALPGPRDELVPLVLRDAAPATHRAQHLLEERDLAVGVEGFLHAGMRIWRVASVAGVRGEIDDEEAEDKWSAARAIESIIWQVERIQRSMAGKTMNRSAGPHARRWRSVAWFPHGAGAAALSLLLALVMGCADESPTELGAGAEEVRRYEPRWSHDPPWQPCEAPGEPGLRLVTCAEAPRRLAGFPAPAVRASPARAGEDAGSSSFEAAAIRRSLTRLREERLRRPDDASVENDLAAALVVAAQVEESPVLLVQALGAIERAQRLDPENEIVAFNRALVLGYLHLPAAAEEAWSAYLRLDPDSSWSGEARERLEREQARRTERATAVTDPAVDDPQRERHRLEVVVLAEWAEIDDPARARAFLEEQVPSVRRLAAATGDDLLLDTYGLLLDASAGTDVARQRDLREGHRLLAEGRSAQDRGTFAESLPVLRLARSLLNRAGSPFWLWAEHGILRCAYQRSDFAEVEEIGAGILSAAPGRSAVAARTWWVLGSARFGRGEFAAAEEAFVAAAGLFAGLGEKPNRIAMDSMLAALHEWVGRRDAAWEARHAVLAELSDSLDPKRLRIVLVDAAMAAADFGERDAALAFQDLAVAQAEREADPVSLGNALLKRGGLVAGAPSGATALAEVDFARSAETIETISDPDQRAALRAQLLLEWGMSELAHGEAESALRRLSESVLVFESGDSPHLWLPEANAALGRALAATGDYDGAVGRLDAASRELGRQRLTTEGVFERVLLADRTDAVHEVLLSLLLDRGEGRRALAEVRRARVESWRTRTSGAMSLPPGVPPPLGSEVATVTYAVLADRIAIWVEQTSGVRLFQVDIPREALEELIRTARDMIVGRDDGALRLLRDLHRLLVEPMVSELEGIERLVIEPDESLYGTPFAALLAADGSYLIERYSISVSALPGGRSPAVRSSAPRRLLVVADPAFSESRYPRLVRLPAAREEAVALAKHYAEPVLLIGEDATPHELLGRIGEADVVHVAAHGLASSRNPMQSFLALAPGAGDDDGALTVEDLLAAEATASPVVVLAACESAGGFIGKADGPVGLAWPFLARGASAVVATLWEIDDRAVGSFVVRLHEGLSRGQAPENALRTAQLAALRLNDGIEVWAPWMAIYRADAI